MLLDKARQSSARWSLVGGGRGVGNDEYIASRKSNRRRAEAAAAIRSRREVPGDNWRFTLGKKLRTTVEVRNREVGSRVVEAVKVRVRAKTPPGEGDEETLIVIRDWESDGSMKRTGPKVFHFFQRREGRRSMILRAMISTTVVAATLVATAAAADKVDFEQQIQPIFLEHCAECHGGRRALGRLRLHTAAALQERWDAAEELILPGEPEMSELYSRLVLPEDDNKRMPKDGDPLPQQKIDLIANWIQQGALLSAAAADRPAEPPAEDKPLADDADPADETAAEAKPETPAELPLPEVAAAPQEAVDRLGAAGAIVLPLYAQSNLLQISFPGRDEPVGDAEVALLADVAEQVHALNLAGAEVSANGLAPLAELENLAALHLERSSVTDEALAYLSGLERLEYLNLYGTTITDAGLKQLASLKNLRRLYLWQTEASYDAAMALESEIPGLVANLGFNHPVVVRMRLTQELEVAEQRAEEAKAAEEQARQQHEAAKKELEITAARLDEIQQQLQELEDPPPADDDEADSPQVTETASAAPAE